MSKKVENLKPFFRSVVKNNEESDLKNNDKSIIICMDKIYHIMDNERNIEAYLKRKDDNILFNKLKRKIGLNKIQSIIFSYLAMRYDRDSTDIDDLSNYLSCSRLHFLTFMKDIEILEKKKLVVFYEKKMTLILKFLLI